MISGSNVTGDLQSPAKGVDHYDGYGPENASFGSIVIEAASIAFTMLLSSSERPE